jgi:hypothetical protein
MSDQELLQVRMLLGWLQLSSRQMMYRFWQQVLARQLMQLIRSMCSNSEQELLPVRAHVFWAAELTVCHTLHVLYSEPAAGRAYIRVAVACRLLAIFNGMHHTR